MIDVDAYAPAGEESVQARVNLPKLSREGQANARRLVVVGHDRRLSGTWVLDLYTTVRGEGREGDRLASCSQLNTLDPKKEDGRCLAGTRRFRAGR